MIIKTISATYERKINLGNYNSVNLGMTAWADLGEGENAELVAKAVRAYCRENVRAEALQLIEAIRKGRNIGQENNINVREAEMALSEWQSLEQSLSELIETMGTFGDTYPLVNVSQSLAELAELASEKADNDNQLPQGATELTPAQKAKLAKGKAAMDKILAATKSKTEGEGDQEQGDQEQGEEFP